MCERLFQTIQDIKNKEMSEDLNIEEECSLCHSLLCVKYISGKETTVDI